MGAGFSINSGPCVEKGLNKCTKNICKIQIQKTGSLSKLSLIEYISSKNMKTIWVIGGPGCGKGTQCDLIIKKYGFLHLSSGDLLRDEVTSGSSRGASLQELMTKGLLVPTDIVLDLIKEKMEKACIEGTTKTGFLIDGYPRELEQGILFKKNVCAVDLILFFDVSNETMSKRLLGRAAVSQRADDNVETIKKRIETFNEKNGKIVEYYKDKIVRINAERSVEEIFNEVCTVLDRLLA
ncbi:hypothetical protein HZH68_005454 [Vespula germanica]|uniref:Adenylate kinase isoenzyme 1 n=1 Tax=Vespula germanica TaxID=30212 RepID=A0A834NEK3_VESGE|nr:hypothetical protein HZH68_005454 [Vespula germanica]